MKKLFLIYQEYYSDLFNTSHIKNHRRKSVIKFNFYIDKSGAWSSELLQWESVLIDLL
jgi:hypothetical protein